MLRYSPGMVRYSQRSDMLFISRRSARSAEPRSGLVSPQARSHTTRRPSRILIPVVAAGGLLALSAAAPGAHPAAAPGAHQAAAAARSVAPVPALSGPILAGRQLPAPLSTTACRATFHLNCYTPLQYRTAYDLNPLYSRGITGSGRTIVIVDSYGSPTIQNDIKVFDAQFGLPNPVLQVDKFGTIPPFDPTNSTMVGWAEETTLDVEYAHSIAPGAKIVLAETPVAETEGVTGFPEMMNAEKSLIEVEAAVA